MDKGRGMAKKTKILKRSERWYFLNLNIADWREDTKHLDPVARDFWHETILSMNLAGATGKLSGDALFWMRECGCTEEQFRHSVAQINHKKTADVTERNGIVTIVCRRMQRAFNRRKSGRNKVYRWRKRKSNHDVTRDVTGKKAIHNNVTTEQLNNSPFIPPEGEEGEREISDPKIAAIMGMDLSGKTT